MDFPPSPPLSLKLFQAKYSVTCLGILMRKVHVKIYVSLAIVLKLRCISQERDQNKKKLSEPQCHCELIEKINEYCYFFGNIHFTKSVSTGRSGTEVIQDWVIKITVVEIPGKDKQWRLSLLFLERQWRTICLTAFTGPIPV